MNNLPESFVEKYQAPTVEGVQSFHFPVDGGGRDLIRDLIKDHSLKLMIEIGCFLCGSTRQWLEVSEDLVIIGVDPWEGSCHLTLERYSKSRAFDLSFSRIPSASEFIQSVKEHGTFKSAMANMQEYKSRFFPVRGKSPEKLHELSQYGINPDVVYFDSNKVLDDLPVADVLFPDAILCGDDWSWGRSEGFPVQKAVNAYCNARGYCVDAKSATWVITK